MKENGSSDRGRLRWRRALALGTLAAAAALAWVAVGACRSAREAGAAAENAATSRCRTLARLTGPEDLVVEEGRRRLLVSAVDRRARPAVDGAIWQLRLDAGGGLSRPRRMPLSGRDGCSFRPHGIELAAGRGPAARPLLYVVNHHDPRDAGPESRCFDSEDRSRLPLAGAAAAVTSVEVFAVEEHELHFLRRLAAPGALTGGNDLVALPDGDLWVTVPPSRPLALLAELAGWSLSSRLVHFDCAGGGVGCPGTWRSLEPPEVEGVRPGYVNGIAWRPGASQEAAGEAGGEILVASTLAGGVFAYRLAGDELAAGRRLAVEVRGPDNLSWADEGRRTLLAAAHPSLRRFLRHASSPAVPSPSEVWEIDADDGSAQRTFHDPGRRISAASSALRHGGEIVLGQVFGDTVEACVATAGGS